MPITSVNLSSAAYAIFEEWRRHRHGSAFLSSAVIAYEHDRTEGAHALLMPGDERVCVTGERLTWTADGWTLKGGVKE